MYWEALKQHSAMPVKIHYGLPNISSTALGVLPKGRHTHWPSDFTAVDIKTQ